MIHLTIWVTLRDGRQSIVGEVAFEEPDAHGAFRSEFRYVPEWLSSRDAFAIDPVQLPLGDAVVHARGLEPPLGVLDDALPDDWGRRLLVRAHRLAAGRRGSPYLLQALGGDGLGALSFAPAGGRPPPARTLASSTELARLLDAATSIDRGEVPAEPALARLLAAGSSPGGSRPKVLVHDTNGAAWIAKFPSPARDEGFDVVGLEATCMALAGRCGLVVPETRLVRIGRRKVLLVRRFDLSAGGGRVHMLSLRTLCGERPGVFVQSYGEVAAAIRRVTRDLDDIDRFFRHMTFNAAIGNTDDHLKNFWMLHGVDGFVLAPSFDLVPDVARRREHALAFQYEHHCPTRAVMLEIARHWRVRAAGEIIDGVVESLKGFEAAARRHGVVARSVREIGRDIAVRIERLMG